MNYPRYFTRVGGFTPAEMGIIYFRVDDFDEGAWRVRRDGRETPAYTFPLAQCERFVARGLWRELTEEEALAMHKV